jgi:hypothetical protein
MLSGGGILLLTKVISWRLLPNRSRIQFGLRSPCYTAASKRQNYILLCDRRRPWRGGPMKAVLDCRAATYQ